MATNLLKFFSIGSDDGVTFLVGVLGAGAAGFEFAAGVGIIYTWSVEWASGSGLFMAWAVDFWGFSISSFPLPSSVSIEEVSSFFPHGQSVAQIYEDSDNPYC